MVLVDPSGTIWFKSIILPFGVRALASLEEAMKIKEVWVIIKDITTRLESNLERKLPRKFLEYFKKHATFIPNIIFDEEYEPSFFLYLEVVFGITNVLFGLLAWQSII